MSVLVVRVHVQCLQELKTCHLKDTNMYIYIYIYMYIYIRKYIFI